MAAVVRRVMERVRAEPVPGSFSRPVEKGWESRIATDAERALRAVVEAMDGVTAVECFLSPMAGRGSGPWFETHGAGEGAGDHRSIVPLSVRVELGGGSAPSSEALDEVRERVREEAVEVWGLDVRAVDVLIPGPGAEEPAGCDGRSTDSSLPA
ncbi:hypothetical protein [Streptomyces sp. ST2-7A]|uniref:hypothetical protein n=1 Tax=Streptomyces sp. ST2-7A TaxID=2907214 RepID=UPI001F365A20|nr:hypothetical protein [Streptomyces sp. ST2-7A]MCE7082931.1 hypothetical protein [Streptomyces sp. ST2-7A]